ncbi:MAG TPA: bacillithiol biosynthesis cysteine-adding enzyme BshC [Polyangia bacterium]
MPAAFSSAYLAGDVGAQAFLPGFRDRAARAAVAERAAGRAVAAPLLEALRTQNRAYAPSPARERHLDALATAGTVVVVTGQQVGLFLGPLYTVYKAAAAVATARALERETGRRCVPLFWLQTEDHDLAEIDHCHVPRPGAPPLTLRLEAADRDARVSVAHRVIGEEIHAPLGALEEALGAEPHAAFLGLLRTWYRPGHTLAGAFAGVLAALFADEGLVLLDPRQRAVAALAAPLYHAALARHEAIDAALGARGRALEAAGFAEQVPVRPGASLVFFHRDDPAGPRFRLERRDGAWALPGGPALADDELVALAARDPLRFSTSALLRPLLQDTLLPTAAYVGGPGELNYLAQLAPLYELLQVPQPLAVPRARFRLLEDHTRALLAKLGLAAPADAERPRDELLRRTADAGGADPQAAAAVAGRARAALDAHLGELERLDPSLRDPVAKTRVALERRLARLVTQYGRALAERDRVAAGRVDRLQGSLCPGGTAQERFYSLPYFACRHGARPLVERILGAVVPFDAAVRDLDL